MISSFTEWLEKRTDEDSAFGRTRRAAAQGLGPTMPDAEINSRNTAPAWQKDAIVKRNKKKKRKKKVGSPKPQPVVHHDLDTWLQSVDNLKKDLEKLKGKIYSPETGEEKDTKPAKPVDTKPKKAVDKEAPTEDDDEQEPQEKDKKPFNKKPQKDFKKPFNKKPFNKKPFNKKPQKDLEPEE